MKTLVLFENKSEEYVYKPLVEKLGQCSDVHLEVHSVFTDFEAVESLVIENDFDIIVCGTGQTSQLPGLISSRVNVPVFGVPVDTLYGGIDSFISLLQSPFEAPVATCAPGQSDNVAVFLDAISSKEISFFENVHLVHAEHVKDYEYINLEFNRAEQFARKAGLDISKGHHPDKDKLNIYLVTQPSEVGTEALDINVPLLDRNVFENPYRITELYDWAKEGGLWFGTNNTRNALAFASRLAHGSNC